MAPSALSSGESLSSPDVHSKKNFLQRLFRRPHGAPNIPTSPSPDSEATSSEKDDDLRTGLIRRVSRKVVPGLPRAQTFKRQQSELRDNLKPVQPTPAERRAVSVDRRLHSQTNSQCTSNPRTSAPDFLTNTHEDVPPVPSLPVSPIQEKLMSANGNFAIPDDPVEIPPTIEDPDDFRYEVPGIPQSSNGFQQPPLPDSQLDAASMTTSQYDQLIHDELETIWILNLSMHFRDKSKREKFFVTYRERETCLWRRVTISLDYRQAPERSLELDLIHTKYQRDKNAKIYEAIRESLVDIQFYDTVTNLKLETTDNRLHVHVVEDVNEIIQYPPISMIRHLGCRMVRESEIEFDSHMSGFVYKVRVDKVTLIKKEIPGPDTVDEFLYEINALSRLQRARNVIDFYGVVVDDKEQRVKGLLISYAEQGTLMDIIYDNEGRLPWATREKWARQVVQGLSEIHEAGFVQGDFTLSNIVIDEFDNAKIIDINRRGCPVGWEPPEATPLIESDHRISMYIGVKSDLYQLGMVLWALATQEDEPEAHGRPLNIGADIDCPDWYRTAVATCLAEDPTLRAQALQVLHHFPASMPASRERPRPNDSEEPEYLDDEDSCASPHYVTNVNPPNDWSYISHSYVDPIRDDDDDYYPPRGRSRGRRLLPGEGNSPRRISAWSGYTYGHGDTGTTASDVFGDEGGVGEAAAARSVTPQTSKDSVAPPAKPGDAAAPETELVGEIKIEDGADRETETSDGAKTSVPGEEEKADEPVVEVSEMHTSAEVALKKDLAATETAGLSPPIAPSTQEEYDNQQRPDADHEGTAPATDAGLGDNSVEDAIPAEKMGITAPEIRLDSLASSVEAAPTEIITESAKETEQHQPSPDDKGGIEEKARQEYDNLVKQLCEEKEQEITANATCPVEETRKVDAEKATNPATPTNTTKQPRCNPSPTVQVPPELVGIGSAHCDGVLAAQLGEKSVRYDDMLGETGLEQAAEADAAVAPIAAASPAAKQADVTT